MLILKSLEYGTPFAARIDIVESSEVMSFPRPRPRPRPELLPNIPKLGDTEPEHDTSFAVRIETDEEREVLSSLESKRSAPSLENPSLIEWIWSTSHGMYYRLDYATGKIFNYHLNNGL